MRINVSLSIPTGRIVLRIGVLIIGDEMDDRELAELAALPAILHYLIAERRPAHKDTSDPAWREIFEDATYFAQRYGAVYSRNQRE
jgi:hypothetical protein